MNTHKLSEMKTRVQQHVPEIVITGFAVVSGIAAFIYIQKAMSPSELLTEPDRLAGPNMIVLENVRGNLWRDMDEPDNTYSLNGVS